MQTIVVIATPSAAQGRGLGSVRELLAGYGSTLERILRGTGDGGEREFHTTAVGDSVAQEVLELLLQDPDVAGAYINTLAPPPVPGNYTAQQVYFGSPPSGLGFTYLQGLAGGKGTGIKIVDVEYSANLAHAEFNNTITLAGGVNVTISGIDDTHGTQVLGVLSSIHGTAGTNGAVPEANVRFYSVIKTGGTTVDVASAVRAAADLLSPGDVLLIEQQAVGPRYNYTSPTGQDGCIPIEWFPANYEAIRYATDKGINVIEPAGNGKENLDDALYDTRPSNFPTWWVNPFRRTTLDSGAVVVGAGYAPTGMVGSAEAARSRTATSNYGSVVDVQAYGNGVVTTGVGNLYNTEGKNYFYTNSFSGTSSASALVAGVAAGVAGVAKAAGRPALTPFTLRQAVRATGNAQTAGTSRPASQRIGNQIDAPQLVDYLGLAAAGTSGGSGPYYRGNPALNHATYLDAAGYAKSEIAAAVKFWGVATKKVDNVAILTAGNLGDFDLPAAEIDNCLAILDRTGDLRFLDRVCVLLAAAHTSQKTDWEPISGTTMSTKGQQTALRKTGPRRWLYKYTKTSPGVADPEFYGTDLHHDSVWWWHAAYANAALALQTNIGKASPGGQNYSSTYSVAYRYLTNEFEPLWASRGVRAVNKPGAGAIEIPSRHMNTTVARARYHQVMYIIRGKEIDRTMADLTAGWAGEMFEIKENGGVPLVGWAAYTRGGLADIADPTQPPYHWERTAHASQTISGAYHLWVMGRDEFPESLLRTMANSFYWLTMVAGPKAAPASDVGGGGPVSATASETDRLVMMKRGGGTIPARFVVTAVGAVASSRWISSELMKYAFGLPLRFGTVALASDFNQLRVAHDTTDRAELFMDKVGLAQWHLTLNNWVRPDPYVEPEIPDEDPDQFPDDGTDPGDGEPPIEEPELPETTPDQGGSGPTTPIEIFDPYPLPYGEHAFDQPLAVDTLGLIVYDKNWRVLDRVVGGAGKNPISKGQITLEPNGSSGLCKAASVSVGRFLNVPPMANIQLLVNGVPRFIGKITKPPQPRVRRFSPAGDPITLRSKFFYVDSRTQKPFTSAGSVGVYEAEREVIKRSYESNPGEVLEGESEEYQEGVVYDIEGLKSLADKIILFGKNYENVTITAMVKDIAQEFSSKTEVRYDPDLISNIEYVSVRQEFDNATVLSSLDSLAQLAGNVSWGVDAYARFFFLTRSGGYVPDYHLDRDPVELDSLDISAENLINAVVVTGSSFGQNGKPMRTGFIVNGSSIAEYGRFEKVYDYPSAISEIGIPASPAVLALEKPRPVPIYTGVGWEQTNSGTGAGNLPDEAYLVGVRDEVFLRDSNYSTFAVLPGDSTDGTVNLIDSPGWTATLYFEPQYANKLTIYQGQTDTGSSTLELDALFTPDGKYLAPVTGSYLRVGDPSAYQSNNISVYNNGRLIWTGVNVGGKVAAEFEKQLVTKLTVVFDTPSTSGKIYWRQVDLLLEGQNDLERYAETILRYSHLPTVSASFKFPPDQYFDPALTAVITDFNGLTFNYEVSEVTFKFEGGVTAEGKIGRGQINLQTLLALQKQSAEAEGRRLKNIDAELERRQRVLATYIRKVAPNETIAREPWMEPRPVENIETVQEKNVEFPNLKRG